VSAGVAGASAAREGWSASEEFSTVMVSDSESPEGGPAGAVLLRPPARPLSS